MAPLRGSAPSWKPGAAGADPRPAAALGLLLQTVHADDIGRAFTSAATSDVAGAFNLCADEVLVGADLAALFDARAASVPPALVKAALTAAWTLHAVPAAPDLFDALMRVPVMSNAHAKEALGWQPRVSASAAIEDFLDGLRRGAGDATPPLDCRAGGPLRAGEFRTGVGQAE